MTYEHVDRPKPEAGGNCRITGRPGVHRILETRPMRGSVKVACSPRWYSGLTARMVSDDMNCARCLTQQEVDP